MDYFYGASDDIYAALEDGHSIDEVANTLADTLNSTWDEWKADQKAKEENKCRKCEEHYTEEELREKGLDFVTHLNMLFGDLGGAALGADALNEVVDNAIAAMKRDGWLPREKKEEEKPADSDLKALQGLASLLSLFD